ncbi:MAG: GAF domain-containing protein [Akkermansiaceae bacterium]|nr:GAF domain-containing protein [Akkermansiaceae bacterium]
MIPEIDDATRSLLQEVLKRSCCVIHCENSAMWLSEGDHLVPVLGFGPHAGKFVGSYSQPLSEGIISMVHASGQPFCENHIHRNPQHSSRLDQQLGIQTDAMIAVPVISNGEIIGVITCVHTSPAGQAGITHSFQASDMAELEYATALAGRVMGSIRSISG